MILKKNNLGNPVTDGISQAVAYEFAVTRIDKEYPRQGMRNLSLGEEDELRAHCMAKGP